MKQQRHPTCELRYEVKFAREGAPTVAVHAIVKAKYARKPTHTLCGVPVDGLQKMAPHEVGRSRPFVNGPGPADIDFTSVAADPFFGPKGCEECGQRMSI